MKNEPKNREPTGRAGGVSTRRSSSKETSIRLSLFTSPPPSPILPENKGRSLRGGGLSGFELVQDPESEQRCRGTGKMMNEHADFGRLLVWGGNVEGKIPF